jgi:hypothetical protein
MAMPVLDLLLIEVFDRIDVSVHESLQSPLQFDRSRTVLKIHRPGLSLLGLSKPVRRIGAPSCVE